MSRFCSLAIMLAILPAATARGEVDFSRDILPLLSDRCFACHGPDANRREAGLRLDSFEGATAETEGGVRAIVPGDPEASALISRIHASDPDEIMPPPRLNRPLSDQDRALLRAWIEEGATYERHWAFESPVAAPLPEVRDVSWPRGTLDRFILSKLESLGLTPNGEADRATLLRRTSLALTGLPPTLDEIERFEQDLSPDAFERQVDRLLASPRHGERMALDWLDIARFADTLGYQIDAQCFVWPWRDWVIRSYNDDLSYDQFLKWQIAGDLLPNATQDQRLATLFNRLHRQTNEGGSIEQEFRQEYVSDRVHTFGTAFLGLTLECCRCHDHKYDPLPMTDYYSLCATFGRIDECGLYPYGVSTSAAEPSMRLMEPEQEAEAQRRQQGFREAEERLSMTRQSREAAFREWLASQPTIMRPAPDERFTMDAVVDGRLPSALPDKSAGSISGGELQPVPGVVDGGMRFDGDTVLTLDGVGGITRHEPLSVSLKVQSPERKERSVLMHTGPALYALASDASGFELLLEDGKLRWSCIFLWPGCCASVETTEEFPIDRWVDVTVTYDGSSRASGLKIYLDGRQVPTVVLHDHLDKNIVTERMRWGARPRDDRGFAGGMIDELQIYRRTLSSWEILEGVTGSGANILAAANAGDEEALEMLRAHYLDQIDPEVRAAREARSVALRRLEDEFLHQLPLIMTMKESPNPRPFFVLRRGDYASPDRNQPVEPGALKGILSFEKDQVRDRLGLANWMTDPRHPLVSRVAINRYWMQVFGSGIVVTQENFGTQGEPPSHPELLDRLASEFMAEGWSGKRMLRRLVTSATFRQASSASSEKRERDPMNRWWSRGPSQRLSGEAIRDQALAASGTLVERIGGQSVKPWQPAGIWSEAGASGGEYVPDQGAAAHRRSLYTYRKRTAPPPALLTLDAGSREVCQPRRLLTNTPLQPLIFLNDRGFFEAARDLADRARRETQGTQETPVERAFRLLTARWPEAAEVESLQALLDEQRDRYEQDSAGSVAICGVADAEWAALTIVCSTLMASDAAITQR